MTAPPPTPPRRILPAIVVSQFAGTSLWFAGNAVLPDLQGDWGLGEAAVAHATSAVQAGFITGTLVFAFFALADRHSPRALFLACSLAGALANLALLGGEGGLALLLGSRFACGFFLAGIYPVGMKIASGWYHGSLGHALGLLVGALVVGTAFPHLLAALGASWPWQGVIGAVSALAALGGLLMAVLVPNGPYLGAAAAFDPGAFRRIFRAPRFRASVFGYFGHMWELYAFWAYVPLALAARAEPLDVPLWSFAVIAVGFVGCAGGGLLSLRAGSARVASLQLGASGACCLLAPLAWLAPMPLFLAFLLAWGVVVIGDSPQLSALNAANAPRELVGSALTIGNCIGFAISIVSIQLLGALAGSFPVQWLFVLLAPGPLLGFAALRRLTVAPSSPP